MLINPITICVELFGKALLQAQANRAVEQERLADKSRRARELAAQKAREEAEAAAGPGGGGASGATGLTRKGSGSGVGYRSEPTIWRRGGDPGLWVIYLKAEASNAESGGKRLAIYGNRIGGSRGWIRLGALDSIHGIGADRRFTYKGEMSFDQASWVETVPEDGYTPGSRFTLGGWLVAEIGSIFYGGTFVHEKIPIRRLQGVFSEGLARTPAVTGPIVPKRTSALNFSWFSDNRTLESFTPRFSCQITDVVTIGSESGPGGIVYITSVHSYSVANSTTIESTTPPKDKVELAFCSYTEDSSRTVEGSQVIANARQGPEDLSPVPVSAHVRLETSVSNAYSSTEDVNPWSATLLGSVVYRAPQIQVRFSPQKMAVTFAVNGNGWEASDFVSARVNEERSASARSASHLGATGCEFLDDVLSLVMSDDSWQFAQYCSAVASDRFLSAPDNLRIRFSPSAARRAVDSGQLKAGTLGIVREALGVSSEAQEDVMIPLRSLGKSTWAWQNRDFCPIGFAVF